jgi:predicted nucleic acid-binding protein
VLVIDLRKAGLLHAALLLPFAFQIALPLLRTALLDFTRAEIEDLIARGLAVIDLPPDSVGRAITFRSAYPALSINDCFSMALAESQPGCILLTADQNLKNKATSIGIEVHGVLWVSDQLESSGHTTYEHPMAAYAS